VKQVTALSGNVITVVDSATHNPVETAEQQAAKAVQPCKHRREECGETSMYGCCGKTHLAMANRCEKLKTRCVQMGDPVHLDVAVCINCDHRELLPGERLTDA